MNKVIDVNAALDMIKDGDKIAISALGGIGFAQYIVAKMEERFLETGHPAGLTLYSAGGHGGPAGVNDNRFVHKGFLKRHICTHPKVVAQLQEAIENEELEGYILPQGVMNQLYRCAAARQPGLLTKVGLGTYMDPRQEGGKMNSLAVEDIIKLMEIDGEEYLFYKSFPVSIALIKGTYADEKGNVTLDREPLKLELLECALAAKGCGGKVIVQVDHVVESNSLNAKHVVVPAQLVDAIVIGQPVENPNQQRPMVSSSFNPFITGEARSPMTGIVPPPADKLSPDDVLCRRAAFEMYPGAIVNLGVGVGGAAGMVAAAEGVQVEFTLELGVFGGIPVANPFGVSLNPESFVSPPTMFDFYHGENLDVTVLGVAEVDKEGNANASKFAGHRNGQGGFLDISTCAKKVVFCTTLRTKGAEIAIADGKVNIAKEGSIAKFVEKVEQITFNGKRALAAGHEVLFVTERAVFKLEEEGLVLIEIAPGVDMEKDVIAQMDFKPVVSKNLKTMDARIFVPGRMGCFD